MVKINFFEHGVPVMNSGQRTWSESKDFDSLICSEEVRKLTRMRKTMVRMELMTCCDEFGWLIRCFHYAINNYLEEYYPPIPLPVPPDYFKNLSKRAEMAEETIPPPTLNIVLKIHDPLLVKNQPLIPPSLDIPLLSPSPLPSAEPELLGDDQIETEQAFLARADDGTGEKGKMEPQSNDQDKRGKISLIQVFRKDLM